MKKIRAISTLIALAIITMTQFPAIASSEYSYVTDLTVDSYDSVLKWNSSGNNYTGAEVYKVLTDGQLQEFGTTTGKVMKYYADGTYLVRSINRAEDDYGSIITCSSSKLFETALNNIRYSKNTVTMNVQVTNNSDTYSGGILNIQILDVEGNVISEVQNYMTMSVGKSEQIKITMPTDKHQNKICISFWDSLENKNDLAEPISILKEEPDVDYVQKLIQTNDANAAELLKDINNCISQNIPVDYEYANYKILERFSQYLQEDIDNSEFANIYYTENALNKIYTETKQNLTAYLSGAKVPESVPKYETSNMRIDGQTVYATTKNGEVTEERPMYFVGYGHFDQAEKDIPLFEDLGMNTIQVEIGPSDAMLYTPYFKDWGVIENGTPSYTITQDKETYYTSGSGNASAKVSYSADSTGSVKLYQQVEVKPNTKYLLTAYVKSTTANGVKYTCDNYTNTIKIDDKYGWKKIENVYESGSEDYDTTIGFLFSGETEMYIDDVKFCEYGTDVNLLDNNGFETISETDYNFNPLAKSITDLCSTLQSAVDNNIAVCVLLSPHYFPSFLIEKYGIGLDGATDFIKYNVNAPEAKAVIEEFMRGIIPIIKQYKSLNSICISNEPNFALYRSGDYYRTQWAEFLEERYDGDIAKLNALYKTTYTSFDEVAYRSSQYSCDYLDFNDKIFAQWHKWMSDIAHEEAPGIPVHSKIMGYLRDNYKNAINYYYAGADYSEYYDFLDINGCDFSNYIENNKKYLIESMWYDYMRSVKDAPVINSEDHIIPNGSLNYDAEVADYVGQTIYMGAIHGRALTNIWVWERNYDLSNHFNGSVLFRPDVISSITKNTMDLNRNAEQISALVEATPEIGILYSKSSVLLDDTAMNSLYQAYASSVFNGKGVKFIIPSQLGKLNECKLVIVPDAKYVTPETVTALVEYARNGGKIVMMGDECLKYDDQKTLNDASVISGLYEKAEILPYVALKNGIYSSSEDEFYAMMRNVFKNNNVYHVDVRDAKSGENVSYVEYNVGVCDGKIILNLLNFEEKKSVKIYVNDTLIDSAVNIITNETVTDTIQLDKYIPVTLEIDAENGLLELLTNQ